MRHLNTVASGDGHAGNLSSGDKSRETQGRGQERVGGGRGVWVGAGVCGWGQERVGGYTF